MQNKATTKMYFTYFYVPKKVGRSQIILKMKYLLSIC